MRVLFLVNTFPPGYTGGAEVSVYHTCRGLMRAGVDCAILVINNRMLPQALDKYHEYDGIPVHRVSFLTPRRTAWSDVFDGRIYQYVRSELKQLQPDLVHIHNVSGATLAPYVACRVARVPVVNTLHDLWLLCPNNMRYQSDGSFCDPAQYPERCRRCFRRYDYWGDVPLRKTIFAALTSNVKVFISPSQALITQHVRAGYAPNRFQMIPYGFEETRLAESAHAGVRAVSDSASQYRTVVFAGGGIEIKGAGVLLQALPLLARHVERLRVVVAGGGEQRFLDEFRKSAPAIWYLGHVPFADMRCLYASAELSVTPSVWHENSPVVIFENFQVGTPVVGSDFGGISELIAEGETGYCFPVGDAAALAEKIVYHFSRPAQSRRHMRQRCVETARTKLPLDRHLAGVLQVYQEAVRR